MIHQKSLWLFVLPSFGLLACVLMWPLCYAIYLSLYSYTLSSTPAEFIGLRNYIDLLTQDRFWSSLRTTFVIAFSALTVEIVLGFALAMMLFNLRAGARVFTILLFLPNIITPVVAALFLKWIFVSNWGLIDASMISLGFYPPDWLGNAFWAKVTVIMADAWVSTPFVMLVLYAALQQLDHAQIEAATLDGAGSLQVIRHVILPGIAPMVVFAASIRLMDLFRSFDSIYVLTGGGPGTATETITMYTYQLAFRMLDVGKASALGVITLVAVLGMVVVLTSLLPRLIGRAPS